MFFLKLLTRGGQDEAVGACVCLRGETGWGLSIFPASHQIEPRLKQPPQKLTDKTLRTPRLTRPADRTSLLKRLFDIREANTVIIVRILKGSFEDEHFAAIVLAEVMTAEGLRMPITANLVADGLDINIVHQAMASFKKTFFLLADLWGKKIREVVIQPGVVSGCQLLGLSFANRMTGLMLSWHRFAQAEVLCECGFKGVFLKFSPMTTRVVGEYPSI